jgi:hypothetical protein
LKIPAVARATEPHKGKKAVEENPTGLAAPMPPPIPLRDILGDSVDQTFAPKLRWKRYFCK